MNKKKKITLVLIIIMLLGTIFSSKTYAALSCNVSLKAQKKEVTYKEQFYVYVAISSLQTTKGIIAIGAELSYDTKSLTLVDIEGENKWSAPFYSSSTGKLTSVKNKLSTNNENVFKIIFEVNENAKTESSAWIKINNFEISDGDEEKNCGGNSINITIADENAGDNNQGENNNQNTGTTSKPNTGTTNKPSSGNIKKPNNTSKNESTSNEESNNENQVTNTIENVIENTVNDENEIKDNNIQNTIKEDNSNSKEDKEIKMPNKLIFYTVSVVTIIAIVGMLFLIRKYWKTN